jgi:tRNA(Ile)-lysidine synthase
VSGGADSLALLVLAVSGGCDVTAWHVDHGLRPGSDADAAVVAEVASRYGAGFRSLSVDVGPGPNLEGRARRARFAALPAGVATGHTADDQAETVLLALLRGAGLDGLTGMQGTGSGARSGAGSGAGPGAGVPVGVRHPILALRRTETAQLCAEEGLDPLIDPSNADAAFRRNRVRHELLPLAGDIAGRDLVPLLVRMADLLRADGEVLADMAAEVDPTDADALVAAPLALARRAVRTWLTAGTPSGYPPASAAVERVLGVARGDAVACEVAGAGRVRRHRRRLVLEAGDEVDPTPTAE